LSRATEPRQLRRRLGPQRLLPALRHERQLVRQGPRHLCHALRLERHPRSDAVHPRQMGGRGSTLDVPQGRRYRCRSRHPASLSLRQREMRAQSSLRPADLRRRAEPLRCRERCRNVSRRVVVHPDVPRVAQRRRLRSAPVHEPRSILRRLPGELRHSPGAPHDPVQLRKLGVQAGELRPDRRPQRHVRRTVSGARAAARLGPLATSATVAAGAPGRGRRRSPVLGQRRATGYERLRRSQIDAPSVHAAPIPKSHPGRPRTPNMRRTRPPHPQ
jgi:hypothetical protein